jgi:hypothetical protein
MCVYWAQPMYSVYICTLDSKDSTVKWFQKFPKSTFYMVSELAPSMVSMAAIQAEWEQGSSIPAGVEWRQRYLEAGAEAELLVWRFALGKHLRE